MLKIVKADSTHYQYFKKEILEEGAGYIVSDKNSVVGLFSFLWQDSQATLNFTYVFDMNAISLAVDTFLTDFPKIESVKYLGNQNLNKIGFKKKEYKRN